MADPENGIRYCAILDTETSGLNPAVDRTLEIAVMLFHVKHAQPVASFSSLIQGPAENAAESVNGIPAAMFPEAREADRVWSAVRWIIEPAQVVIAHHAAFDKQFVPDLGKPWACSENDFAWPGRARGGSLAHLALSLGLGVASAHRAMCDVDTLARIFTRIAEMGHDLEPMIVRAMRPKVRCISLAPFEQKDIVKAAGFRWEQDKKIWWRDMPLEDTNELPFKVRVQA